MKKIINILAVLIVAFTAHCCINGNQQNNVDNAYSDSLRVKNSCKRIIMDDVLYECIDTYIGKHLIIMPTQDWMYYNLLFFKENNKEYFTIWFFDVRPDAYIAENLDTSAYNFDMDMVRDRKVIFVWRKDENYKIFESTNDSRRLASHERNIFIGPPSYDGDRYYQTYEIIHRTNDRYILIETDSANIFFNPHFYYGNTKVKSAGNGREIFY